ncbi:enoyl-CoA hydratase/isomerase family protein [Streptomyces canus]|uniref:enoyl-CoA hydratase/isomerase family protein n=1 Tax=Streptomyces canus TaxID=58343 RepID=UPI0033CB9F05
MTFANPPVNLIVGETVLRLIEIVETLATDPDIQVVVFDSATPDFFYNHFDLAAAADFPAPEDENAVPAWTSLVLALFKAPYITIAAIRGRTRGGGNELALALDLRYASREKAIFGQPEVGSGLLPGGGGSERLPRAIGRDRALEAILTSDDYDADTAERWGWTTRALPDSELDASSTRSSAGSPPSTAPPSPRPKPRSTGHPCPRTRIWSPPTASSPTPSPSPGSSSARPARRPSSSRPASTSSTAWGSTSAPPTSSSDRPS